MSFMVKDQQFYKTFLSMTLVIAMQNLITFSVNLADNVMIGGYSQTALSGVAVVNQIQFLLQMIITGVGNGMVVLGAQYWGKGQIEPIRRVTSIGMWIGLGAGMLLTVLTALLPGPVLGLLTNEQEVIAEGVKYLRIVCASYMIFSFTNLLLASLRSVETVKIGFAVTLTALVVNVLLNYGLIYGNLGMPRLGVEGAAIATLVSRIVEALVIGWYVLCKEKKLRWRPSGLFHLDGGLFRDYVRVSLPLIVSSSMWGIAMSVQSAILGRLGSDTIAANSIAVTLFQVVSVVLYASANASGVIIGKAVGEGSIPLVKAYAKSLQVLYLIIGVLTGGAFLLSRDLILSLYSITPATHALAATFINILSVTVIGSSYQVASLCGIVTGGGDTRFVLISDFISQWLLVIPAAFLSAFVIKAPVWVTFLCLKIDQPIKCIPAFIKVNRFRWIHVLTREQPEPIGK